MWLVPSGADSKLVETPNWEFPLAAEGLGPEAFSYSQPVLLLENLDEAAKESRLVFPQVPATVPEGREADGSEGSPSLPLCLQRPLQKASSSQLSNTDLIEVYASGMRSAIISEGEALYRFKGVGNGISNSDIQSVFPVRIVGEDNLRARLDATSPDYADIKDKPIEIRGAMFNFTAVREQAITSTINHHLLNHNIPIANEPRGYYQYKEFEVQIPGNDVSSKISLCCGLYRTHGDKRLASHLLWGLELLIPFIFELNSLTLPIPEVAASPSTAADSSSEAIQTLGLDSVKLEEPIVVQEEAEKTQDGSVVPPPVPIPPMPSNWILDRFETSRKTYMASLNEVEVLDTAFAALEGDALLISLPEAPIPAEVLLKHMENPLMPEETDQTTWKELWNEEWEKLRKLFSGGLSSLNVADLLGLVYWSIGRQAGRTLKTIHEAGVNWGTFADLLGNHCNAHPNNFIVLKKGDAERQMRANGKQNGTGTVTFIAPLDFDLAFTKSTYIVEQKGANKDERWNELREMEVNAMRLALGGLNINSGVEGKSSLPFPLLEPIRIALRDTLVKAFSKAYETPLDAPSEEPEKEARLLAHESSVHSLIRLALILSESIVA